MYQSAVVGSQARLYRCVGELEVASQQQKKKGETGGNGSFRGPVPCTISIYSTKIKKRL